MEKHESICQSCGMPMQGDSDFGTNKDDSKNQEYCTYCFNNGKFTDEGITMEQKIDKIVKIAMSQSNISEVQARQMANTIVPELKCWCK